MCEEILLRISPLVISNSSLILSFDSCLTTLKESLRCSYHVNSCSILLMKIIYELCTALRPHHGPIKNRQSASSLIWRFQFHWYFHETYHGLKKWYMKLQGKLKSTNYLILEYECIVWDIMHTKKDIEWLQLFKDMQQDSSAMIMDRYAVPNMSQS